MDFKKHSRGEVITNESSQHTTCKTFGCHKHDNFNWLEDLPQTTYPTDIVEVRFKNTRKGFYKNINLLALEKGDVVAVEASPGHDIGIVSLTGELALEQLRKFNINPKTELKKIYRKAKPTDVEKWQSAISREHEVMLEARQISEDLKLDMKIGDVEYQGDGTKAIFYYIADDRVDFRELIKVLAERFRIRVEMRQIGARQEAGRIGGVGSCGRELCCATFVTNFVSVTTNSARYQELSLNPQKLAGQCSKLKCCLNYEVDCYYDAQLDFPSKSIPLETEKGRAFHQKTDVYKRLMWYSLESDSVMNIVAVTVERVKQIVELNRRGIKVKQLNEDAKQTTTFRGIDFENIAGQESLTRFDDKKNQQKNKRKQRNFREDQRKEVDYKQLDIADQTLTENSELSNIAITAKEPENTEKTTRERSENPKKIIKGRDREKIENVNENIENKEVKESKELSGNKEIRPVKQKFRKDRDNRPQRDNIENEANREQNDNNQNQEQRDNNKEFEKRDRQPREIRERNKFRDNRETFIKGRENRVKTEKSENDNREIVSENDNIGNISSDNQDHKNRNNRDNDRRNREMKSRDFRSKDRNNKNLNLQKKDTNREQNSENQTNQID